MVNIAVLGYGTVGSGVVEVINTNHDIVNKRILFDRLNKDTYVILAIFIKKSQRDKGYHDFLVHRHALYRLKEEDLKRMINDPVYLAQSEEVLSSLLETLSKTSVNKMGGM